MKKKIMLGIFLTFIMLGLLGTTACNSLGGNKDTVSQQLVNVTRGDLTLSVSGKGKIETLREARSTFGSGGKLEKILVKEGDNVKTGDVMAKLDTSPLTLALNQSQMAVTQAEVALTQAQLAQQTAEYNLESTRNSDDSLQLALLNAQIALDTAHNNLAAGIAAIDFVTIQAELNKAKAWYDYVKIMPQGGAGDSDSWSLALDRAKERLDTVQANYDNALAGYDSNQVNLKKKQVEAAEISVTLAQKNIDELSKTVALQELQVASSEQTVKQAQQAVDLARQSLAESQRQLAEATIFAPFDGVVAMVLAKEGDIIPSPTMAPQAIIQIIDPDSLELVIEVDEIDIPQVKMAQGVTVNLDALPKAVFTGRVTAIYPVPSEVGGVVLYKVRINLDTPEESGIKVGMSASADIVAEKHENVLLVPSRAISKNGQGQTVVKVKANEQIQEKEVVVGLDDGLRTEITGGLSEGETVVVEVRVKSTSGMSLF